MNLVSGQFILIMVATFILYYLTPKKYKYLSFLIMSIVFYIALGTKTIIYIIISTLTTYFAAILIHKNIKKKLILASTLILNIGVLIFMKSYFYMGDLFFKVAVPIGISYYTFQIVSYIIDVYKEKYEPERNILKYFLYTMYFPYLSIGPINRYNDISKTLYTEDKKINFKDINYGVFRISLGFFKKLVIANRIAIIIAIITGDTAVYNGGYAFLAMILYSIEIYCDFSGGIDIVIGFSRTLGIRLMENFDKPYLAGSAKEFWRRWHISLGTWFKDYVYIPLGGNRCSNIRNSINLIIVFTLSGLWHGVNYIIWGLAYGIIMCIEKLKKSKHRILDVILTFLIVSILWSFYIWEDNLTALKMMASLFTKFNYAEVFANILNLGLDIENLIVLAVAVISLIIFELNDEKIKNKIVKTGIETKILIFAIFVLVIVVFGIYGIGFNVNEFIYNKF